MVTGVVVRRTLWAYRKQLVTLVTPLILLPIPLAAGGEAARCGYVLLLMAVYWCTEALPLAVTSLLPLVLLPLMEVLPAGRVAEQYYKTIVWMMIGALIVAAAVERSELHRRIALNILIRVGTQPALLILGFMLPTWFLSMWISNTAATSMMIPIMEAVLQQLESVQDPELMAAEEELGSSPEPPDPDIPLTEFSNPLLKEEKASDPPSPTVSARGAGRKKRRGSGQGLEPAAGLGKAMTLCVAYSANAGGLGTLLGTPPNLVTKDAADSLWQEHGYSESPITFSSWLVLGLPLSTLYLLLIWAWLVLYYLGPRGFLLFSKRKKGVDPIKAVLVKAYKQLPKMSYEEWMSLIAFIVMVLLWFFRNPGFMPGWGSLFPSGYMSDCVASLLVAVLLFWVPRHPPHWVTRDSGKQEVEPLLTWEYASSKLPWGITILFGGGMSLAEACIVSGLSGLVSQQMIVFGTLPPWLMVALITFIVSMITEVTSNTAMCTLVMPICISMAEAVGVHPLSIMLPVCVGTSLAFMMPVGTPPNSLVFQNGRISVLDMIKAGAALKLLSLLPVLAVNTWVSAYFQLDQLPWNLTRTDQLHLNLTDPSQLLSPTALYNVTLP